MVCAQCGEGIGVYDAVWVERADQTVYATSRLNLGEDPLPGLLWHAACISSERYPARGGRRAAVRIVASNPAWLDNLEWAGE